MMKTILLALSLAFASPALAGGFLTEIGGGWKLRGSHVLMPECRRVLTHDPFLLFEDGTVHPNPQGDWESPLIGRSVPCGGNNPAFIGWPIAWEFSNGNTRVGWFHYSNWFDGGEAGSWTRRGDEFETTFDCICASHTFRWGKSWKKKK